MTVQRGGQGGWRRHAELAVLVALLVPAMSDAQVRTPVAPGPRLPPAPAPVVSSIAQRGRTIGPTLRFDLPPGTVGVRVLRQANGGQPELLTPTALPPDKLRDRLAQGAAYQWNDETLRALGSYSYSVVAELEDGRRGPSTWFPYTPRLYDAINARVEKLSNYDVRVEFNDGAIPAAGYRLFGTGIAPTGEPAVLQQLMYQDPATRQLYTVWHLVRSGLAAGSYHWVLRAEFQPGLQTAGIPLFVAMP